MHYGVLRDHFIERCVRPIWERFVDMAVLSGKLNIPAGSINQRTLWNAGFQGPTMPWIDPQKEVTAEEKSVSAGFKSRSQVIRERGGNPQDVFEQIKQEREQDTQAGLTFSSSASKPVATPEQPKTEGEDDADKPGNTDTNA